MSFFRSVSRTLRVMHASKISNSFDRFHWMDALVVLLCSFFFGWHLVPKKTSTLADKPKVQGDVQTPSKEVGNDGVRWIDLEQDSWCRMESWCNTGTWEDMEFIARSCCRLFLTFWLSFEVSSIICSACILWHPDRPKRGPVQRALRKALRRSKTRDSLYITVVWVVLFLAFWTSTVFFS